MQDELLGVRHDLAAQLPVDFGSVLAGSTTLTDVLVGGERLTEGTAPRDPATTAMYVGAPVRRAGKVIGVLALRLPLEGELAAVVEERAFGDTGVVLVVTRAGAVVATSTDPDVPRAAWRPPTGDPWSVADTAMHNDHSGYPVVTAWRWLPDLGMGVVAEQRQAETLAFASYVARLLAVLSGVVGVLVTTVWVVPQVAAARSRRERRRWLDDQRGVMRAVAATERRYRALVDPSPDAVLLVDRHGVVLDANPAAAAHFGARRATMVGDPIDVLGLDDRSARAVAATLERVVLLGEPGEIDRVRWAPSGRPAGWFRVRAVPDLAGRGGDPHVHLVLSDISELVDHQERLAELALVDPLTGLANRLAILDRIDRATRTHDRSLKQTVGTTVCFAGSEGILRLIGVAARGLAFR
jgi:PAS domain S-box-containing protein